MELKTSLKNCFDEHGASFYREVRLNNEKIGVIRALRPLDQDALQPWLGPVEFGREGPRYRVTRPNELMLARIVISLGGEIDGQSYRVGAEGWALDRPVTIEAVNALSPEALMAFHQAVMNLEREYFERKEAILKNSSAPSG